MNHEIRYCASRSVHRIDTEFLYQGLHELPDRLNRSLKETLSSVEPDKYDYILLNYGLCGNGLNEIEDRAVRQWVGFDDIENRSVNVRAAADIDRTDAVRCAGREVEDRAIHRINTGSRGSQVTIHGERDILSDDVQRARSPTRSSVVVTHRGTNVQVTGDEDSGISRERKRSLARTS